jgi:hypothetical protein
MEYLYVLELTCGKYFVGKSRDVEHTYAYYACGFGPPWNHTLCKLDPVEVGWKCCFLSAKEI